MRWDYRNPAQYWALKFAWFPTIVEDKKVWLEFYERKFVRYRFYRKRLFNVHKDRTDYGDA